MYQNFKSFAAFLFTIIAISSGTAAHIVGGDMVYKCLGSDPNNQRSTFEIIMTVYRDSKAANAADFDSDAFVGVFEGSGSNWTVKESLQLKNDTPTNVPWENECLELPSNVGVEKAIYRFTLSLNWSNQNYLIAYQRCCRNGTISNIIDPGGTGAVFSVEITPEAQRSCNDSPEFSKFPPIVICVNQPLNFDHSASDKQGDQVVYEFCAPQASGGKDGDSGIGNPNTCTGVRPKPEICKPPFGFVDFNVPTFTEVNPVGGNPQVAINPTTGLITGTPTVNGQYVVGVCAKEYRNGALLSVIRRDFQFNVTTCKVAVAADLEPDISKITEGYVEQSRTGRVVNITSCGAKEIFLKNKSIEEKNIKVYQWIFDLNGTEIVKNTRDASIELPSFGSYDGKLILNPQSAECSDSLFLKIKLFDLPNADFSFTYDTCVAEAVSFTNLSTAGVTGPITSTTWVFDDLDTSIVQSPSYFFEVPGYKDVNLSLVDVNGCKDTITKTISYFPVPALIVVKPNQFIGCQPADILFTNLSLPIDSTYNIEWSFGDGMTSDQISPSHIYEDLGLYDVSIKITSPIGCFTSRNFPELIEILEKPIASFTYDPQQVSIYNNTVNFTDESQGGAFWFWEFGNSGLAYEPNPTFTFPDTGVYKVNMIVSHISGCTDTASAIIDVKPLTELFMPNAFTPNNDGLNDDFKGKGQIDGILSYSLQIWNRWGEMIFETNDPQVGWNGEKHNNGQLSPQGVYVYTVNYISPRGEQKSLKGHVTLIR